MGKNNEKNDRTKSIIKKEKIIVLAMLICSLVVTVISCGKKQNGQVSQETNESIMTESQINESETDGSQSNAETETRETNFVDADESQENESSETAGNSDEKETSGRLELTEKAQATYEEWAAAAMTVAISMQYPDFQLEGIYLTGETALEEKEKSNGVYVVFTTEGKTVAIYSKPLKEERTQKGTVDLSTSDLGFATFDVVKENSINKESCQKVELEDLTELIKQSMLVSIYEH